LKDITSAIDANTERLVNLAIENDAYARERHEEEIDRIQEVGAEITTWKGQSQSKEDGKFQLM
jgi:hypothetical protein